MTLTFTHDGLEAAARAVFNEWGHLRCWCFEAPMGSGKTTFIHALCAGVLGVTDAVGSPTYALMNEYESPVAGTIVHMDWYRLRSEEEAIDAGVEDALYSGAFCLVEWPVQAPGLLPERYAEISITVLDDLQRRLTVKSVERS